MSGLVCFPWSWWCRGINNKNLIIIQKLKSPPLSWATIPKRDSWCGQCNLSAPKKKNGWRAHTKGIALRDNRCRHVAKLKNAAHCRVFPTQLLPSFCPIKTLHRLCRPAQTRAQEFNFPISRVGEAKASLLTRGSRPDVCVKEVQGMGFLCG